MNNRFVYIIIINWNGYTDTVECLKSILNIKYKSYKVILIDNGSKIEEFKKLSKKFKKNKNVILRRNEVNKGFAGGVNIGILHSIKHNGEYSLLLNNDTVVEKYFLDELINVSESDNLIAITAPKIFRYDQPNVVWNTGVKFNYYFPPFSKSYAKKIPGEVTDVIGCCMLIRNDVFKSVGYFDESYFVYGEESDFNFKVKKLGYKIYSVPTSIIWHKISSSTGRGFNPTVAYFKMRNKILYAKKNYPIYYWPTYLMFLLLYFLKNFIASLITRKYDVSKALFKGALAGL